MADIDFSIFSIHESREQFNIASLVAKENETLEHLRKLQEAFSQSVEVDNLAELEITSASKLSNLVLMMTVRYAFIHRLRTSAEHWKEESDSRDKKVNNLHRTLNYLLADRTLYVNPYEQSTSVTKERADEYWDAFEQNALTIALIQKRHESESSFIFDPYE